MYVRTAATDLREGPCGEVEEKAYCGYGLNCRPQKDSAASKCERNNGVTKSPNTSMFFFFINRLSIK